MTRAHFLCLLAGTALTGISVGRWSRPVVVIQVQVTAPVAVTKSGSVAVSSRGERSLLTRIQSTESNVNFAELWAELQRSRLPRAWRKLLEEVLMDHWVAFDLSGCLERCNDLPLETKPGVPWIGSALAAYAKRDAKTALKLADAVDRKFPPDQWVQARELSRVVAKLEPAGFLSGKFELSRQMQDAGRSAALESLARTDAAQAVKLAQRYPSAATGEAALGRSASVIASSAARQMGDSAALSWAESLNGLTRSDRQAIRSEILNQLAVSNPNEATAHALAWDPKKQGPLPQQLWPLLSKQDPTRAWLMADQSNPAALQGLAAQLVPDAATLAATLLNVQDSSGKEISLACLETTLAGLATERVQAMMAECAQLPDGPRKDKIYAAALGAWARQEPAAAMAQVMNMDDAAQKRVASLTIIQTLGASAETHAEHLPNLLTLIDAAVPDDASETKSQDIATCEAALTKLTRANPEAVLEWLQVQKDWQRYNRWLPHVLAGMATAHPAQAVCQALMEPIQQVRNDSINAVLGQWIDFDPKTASVWARALPEGPERAAAALTLAKGIASVEPTSAYPWALEAAPGQQRQELLTAIFQQWEEDDPGAPSRIVPGTLVDDALQADLEAAWKEAHP